MKTAMIRGADLSECGRYRYGLYRGWEPEKGYAMFIGLNPSTADAVFDDPTIRRCVGYAKLWGYGALCMANLFAWRATDPQVMIAAEDPIGPENDFYLKRLSADADVVVAAWGNLGRFMGRDDEVRALIKDLHYLKLNKDGSPAHPLYLSKNLTPQRWQTKV